MARSLAEIELDLFLFPAGVLLLFRNSWRRLAGAQIKEIWRPWRPCVIRGWNSAGGWERAVESWQKKGTRPARARTSTEVARGLGGEEVTGERRDSEGARCL